MFDKLPTVSIDFVPPGMNTEAYKWPDARDENTDYGRELLAVCLTDQLVRGNLHVCVCVCVCVCVVVVTGRKIVETVAADSRNTALQVATGGIRLDDESSFH